MKQLEISIDGKSINDYSITELVAFKGSGEFSMTEEDLIGNVITRKIQGGEDNEDGFEECEDCGDIFPEKDLWPWKYEPNLKLCENCLNNRHEEDATD